MESSFRKKKMLHAEVPMPVFTFGPQTAKSTSGSDCYLSVSAGPQWKEFPAETDTIPPLCPAAYDMTDEQHQ